MGDEEVVYEESDGKYTDYESNVVSLSTALDEDCAECGASLMWVLDPDPDSLRYHADCDQCETHHSLNLTHGSITVSDANL